MNFFKAKKAIEIEISLQEITSKSVTVVTKKKSDREGSYRVYVNGWKYNLRGFPILNEDRLKIDATYFKKGENCIQIVTKDSSGNKKTYEEEFVI